MYGVFLKRKNNFNETNFLLNRNHILQNFYGKRWGIDMRVRAIFVDYVVHFHFICYLCVMKSYKVIIVGSGNVAEAFARALRMAIKREPFSYELPSSKGVL